MVFIRCLHDLSLALPKGLGDKSHAQKVEIVKSKKPYVKFTIIMLKCSHAVKQKSLMSLTTQRALSQATSEKRLIFEEHERAETSRDFL